MGRAYSCDLTGETVPDDQLQVLGNVTRREYGPEGAEIVKEYLDALDALHTRLATEWNEGKAKLRASLLERYPDAKLPDE